MCTTKLVFYKKFVMKHCQLIASRTNLPWCNYDMKSACLLILKLNTLVVSNVFIIECGVIFLFEIIVQCLFTHICLWFVQVVDHHIIKHQANIGV